MCYVIFLDVVDVLCLKLRLVDLTTDISNGLLSKLDSLCKSFIEESYVLPDEVSVGVIQKVEVYLVDFFLTAIAINHFGDVDDSKVLQFKHQLTNDFEFIPIVLSRS
ncbi:hypothetical protein GEMRC1_011739 [Eukaryota sp. GEM-RC1]